MLTLSKWNIYLKNQRNIVHQIDLFLSLILDMLAMLGHMFWTEWKHLFLEAFPLKK